jgi:hypothetical protein
MGQLTMPSERRVSTSHQPPKLEIMVAQGNVVAPRPAAGLALSQLVLDSVESQGAQESSPPTSTPKDKGPSFEEYSPPQVFLPATLRKSSSPETTTRRTNSPSSSTLREGQRRPGLARPNTERPPGIQSSAARAGKGLGDGNIVPPISVLIVDGEHGWKSHGIRVG